MGRATPGCRKATPGRQGCDCVAGRTVGGWRHCATLEIVSDDSTFVQRVLPGWNRELRPWDRGNVIAGLTITAYLVPQVMAYATVAGLPAIVGLWAAVPALVFYAFLGSSRVLSMGPESSVALMTAATIAPMAAGDPDAYAGLAAALAIAVGVIGLLVGLVRVSFISDLLSRPVMVGYMAGIGVLMIEGQIDNFLGISTTADELHLHLAQAVAALPTASVSVLVLSAMVLVLLYVLPRIDERIPGPLIAVAVGGLLAAAMNLAGLGIPLVGTVPQGFPVPMLPQVDTADLQLLILGAAGVTLVGFTDTVLTGRAFRQHHDTIDPQAELRAMSFSNLGAGLLQGMAVSSSGSRTALAQTSGARSQGYSLVAAAGVVIVLLVAAPVLSFLPKAGLAALIIYAALRLIDLKEFRWLWRYSKVEFALALITAVAVLVVGILYGVLVAVGLSVLAMLARVARPHSAVLGFVRGIPGMHDIADFPDSAEEPGLLIFRYDSPLFFANAQDFKHEALRVVAEREPELEWFALNCEAIIDIDSTATAVLGSLVTDLQQQGLTVCLVRAKRELLDQLELAGLYEGIGDAHIYATLPTLVAAYREAHHRT